MSKLATVDVEGTFHPGGRPLRVYLTTRSPARGEDAITSLNLDSDLISHKKLAKDGGLVEIVCKELDMASSSSISSFVDGIRSEEERGVNILINNAGIAPEGTGTCTQLTIFVLSRVLINHRFMFGHSYNPHKLHGPARADAEYPATDASSTE